MSPVTCGSAARMAAPLPRFSCETRTMPFSSRQRATISDVPSNFDYAFGAGVFIGDYNGTSIGPDNQAYGFWTDARNGRSSRETTAGRLVDQGRNPLCVDVFDAQ